MKPKFIVIEGGEGCGKSTLCASLQTTYPEYTFTHEPRNTEYSLACRELWKEYWNKIDDFSGSCLMWSQRRDHLVKRVKSALESGQSVICDRCDGSTYAYQVYESSPETKQFFWQIRDICFGDRKPDVYIYLDLDPLVGVERRRGDASGKEMATFDFAEMEKHHSIRSGYREFFSSPDIASHTIDASQPKEKVLSDVVVILKALT